MTKALVSPVSIYLHLKTPVLPGFRQGTDICFIDAIGTYASKSASESSTLWPAPTTSDDGGLALDMACFNIDVGIDRSYEAVWQHVVLLT